MHAGGAKNGCNQRAYGGKFHAATVETTMPAEIQNEKCTPAGRRTATASGHTGANSPPAQSKRPCRRGNRIKNARRHGEERQRPAGIRWQIPPRHRRNDHAGGDTE
ncbi:hypothetical protein [Bianquea renquensis]|uniref:Uncharacterized protein n=1 Tax=Bianquea renquensis TaxID=2763661 RepID=A0A926DSM0_9FIRM|nr:hypothetical protein [Bianquea renquensis]MBC8544523.1 hypothetical protein [Bianquea renquensis]